MTHPAVAAGRRTHRYNEAMVIRQILTAEEPILRERAKKVTQFDASLHRLLDDMLETMRDAPGIGLAANQVGVPLRLFVYDCPDEELRQRLRGVVINPVLETSERPETMPDPEDDEEGCLSVPDEQFPTGRAEWARVTGTDAEGNSVSIEANKRADGWRDKDNNVVETDFDIKVPYGTELDLYSFSGRIDVTGVRAKINAETFSGNVTLTSVGARK